MVFILFLILLKHSSMMFDVLLIFAAGQSVNAFDKNRQSTCMQNLIRMHTVMYKDDQLHTEADACEWKFTQCTAGIVDRIFISGRKQTVQFDPDWFRATVHTIEISSVSIGTSLHTRRLPRSLVRCVMTACELQGSLEMRTLPPALERLDLETNRFIGTLFIMNLPRPLRRVHLAFNSFTKVLVVNETLLEELREIQIYQPLKAARLKSIGAGHVDSRVHTMAYRRYG